jgi:hypothetical protein
MDQIPDHILTRLRAYPNDVAPTSADEEHELLRLIRSVCADFAITADPIHVRRATLVFQDGTRRIVRGTTDAIVLARAARVLCEGS